MSLKISRANSLKMITLIFYSQLLLVSSASACFPGYNREDFLNYNPGSPPLSLKNNQGQTYEYLYKQHSPYYQFQVKNTANPDWKILLMGLESTFSEHTVGIYPLFNNQIKGYVLLESADYVDPCVNETEIQSEIEGKALFPNYLNIDAPEGYQLQIYEQRKGENIIQTALFWYPNQPFANLSYINANLTMRAKYHRDLEPQIKELMRAYFVKNIPEWVANHQEIITQNE